MVPINTPARAAVATAIPITVAKTGRTLRPTSRAVSRSSAVARTLRPQDVRDSSNCRPDRTAHAVRNAVMNLDAARAELDRLRQETGTADVPGTRREG